MKTYSKKEINELKEKMYSLDVETETLEDKICREHLSFGQIFKIEAKLEQLNSEIYKIQKTLSNI